MFLVGCFSLQLDYFKPVIKVYKCSGHLLQNFHILQMPGINMIMENCRIFDVFFHFCL